MLYVDNRWRGHHGIARFGKEVVDRIDLPFTALNGGAKPTSPLDVLNPSRLALGSQAAIYSPGYNAGITVARQFLTVHDLIHLQVDEESSSLKKLYYERVVKPAILRAGVVMTVSKTSRHHLVEWLQTDAVDVIDVGNGCSATFNPTGPIYSAADPYLMYVGNLKAHKNAEVLFEALSLTPEARLIVVASETNRVEGLASKWGVSERVVATTGVSDDELAAMYRGSSGLVYPSRLEGFGLPAAESLACGRPVAYWAGCGSIAEIVGENGIVVTELSSSAAWADAMRTMMSDQFHVRQPSDAHRWPDVALKVQDVLTSRGIA